MKRLLDVFFSTIGLILLLPIFLIIAIFIRFDSPGPVFFGHGRVGKNFKPFELYKFRSMSANAPEKGPSITVGGDSRVTRVGRLLRKTKLDEIPQLINVLKGDMSLVGPRPEVPKYVEMFRDEYRDILQVRPGITDYATIEFRDEEAVLKGYKNPEEGYVRDVLPRKMELYRKYLKNKGLMTDIGLVFRTLWKIVK